VSPAAPPRRVLAWSVPVLAALIVLPFVVPPYQTVLLSYGLVLAIAALGFNLLLGYTGLLSFGHSAYFGVGAYAVAFIVKYMKLESMEAFLVGGVLASGAVAAIFGLLCVRYTKIFFGILTMALSQVLWSLAFKFFWVTGGSDGLRVPTPTLLGGGLALGAVSALALTLIASVRRRRRDLAVLRMLGFTNRQLAAVVAWQSTIAVGIATLARSARWRSHMLGVA